MSFDYSPLITDRTQADVAAQNAKGHYNATDLNRVTAAMEDLRAQFIKYGYQVKNYLPVRNAPWLDTDIPTVSQMEQYIANVEAIRSTIAILPTTPETPEDMELLTWAEANDIEEILSQVETVLIYVGNYAYHRISGTFYAGNHNKLQYFSRGR